MPLVAGSLVLGAASLGAGIIGSQSSKKEQKKMRRALEEQNRIAKEQLKFNMQRYEDYMETYGDLNKLNVANAMEGVTGDFQGVSDRAAADVEAQFAGQRDQERRRLQAYGLDPSSGSFVSQDRRAGLQQAATSALAQNQARNQERNFARNATMQLRQNVGAQGLNMVNSAAGDVNNSYQGLQGSYGNIANMHGQFAAQNQAMANNLFMQAGQFAGMGLGMKYFDNKQQPQTSGMINQNADPIRIAPYSGSPNVSIPQSQMGLSMPYLPNTAAQMNNGYVSWNP